MILADRTDERPLTVAEAADYLQLSEETIRRMLREGRLRGVQPAGRRGGWRVSRAELERFLATGTPRRLSALSQSKQSPAMLRANAQAQAEQARARGDEAGADRFERIADGMVDNA